MASSTWRPQRPMAGESEKGHDMWRDASKLAPRGSGDQIRWASEPELCLGMLDSQ